MEEEKNKEFKKETACLFHNFDVKKNNIQIPTYINGKKEEIGDIYQDIINNFRKVSLTENEPSQRESYGYIRHILSKFMISGMNKPKFKNKKIKPKNIIQLNSKIRFGSFLNISSCIEGYKNIGKYEKLRTEISKSKNFSFIKDPKTVRYKKLPLDLYISKEDKIKIKNLIYNKLKELKEQKDKNESLVRLSYDNGVFDNTIINFKESLNKIKNRQVFYINKNKISNKNNISNNEKTLNNHFDNSKHLTPRENKDSIKKKYNIKKNLSDLTEINSNKNRKILSAHQILYNKTEFNLHPTKKNLLYIQLDKNIKDILGNKTHQNSLKQYAKYSKQKSSKKIKRINKLLNEINLKPDSKIVINDLKTSVDKKKKNKKDLSKQMYLDIKQRTRFLSVVENLKHIRRDAPMTILNNIYDYYTKNSKEVLKFDSNWKKIDNIYKSSEEGKLIKKKIDDKNDVINKIISKNKREGIKLKNKYKKFDLVIEKINDENKGITYNQTDY